MNRKPQSDIPEFEKSPNVKNNALLPQGDDVFIDDVISDYRLQTRYHDNFKPEDNLSYSDSPINIYEDDLDEIKKKQMFLSNQKHNCILEYSESGVDLATVKKLLNEDKKNVYTDSYGDKFGDEDEDEEEFEKPSIFKRFFNMIGSTFKSKNDNDEFADIKMKICNDYVDQSASFGFNHSPKTGINQKVSNPIHIDEVVLQKNKQHDLDLKEDYFSVMMELKETIKSNNNTNDKVDMNTDDLLVLNYNHLLESQDNNDNK